MEEKYPIKFSLGQFVLLLGVEIVVLSLVFLLGARFGGTLFEVPNTAQNPAGGAYQSLAPAPAVPTKPANKAAGKLVDGQEEGEELIGAVQEGEQLGNPSAAGEEGGQPGVTVGMNKNNFHPGMDKNTMVRFKSSENTKFSVEVGVYFDEVVASTEISKLKLKGLDPYLAVVEERGGKPSFSVRMGSFGDRTLAEQFAVKISNEKGLELRVVQVN